MVTYVCGACRDMWCDRLIYNESARNSNLRSSQYQVSPKQNRRNHDIMSNNQQTTPVPNYQDPKRSNRIQAGNQYEEIGEVNFCALEMNAYDALERKPVVREIHWNNGFIPPYTKALPINAFPPPSRESVKSRPCITGSCRLTALMVLFLIIATTSLTMNILMIKGVIVTAGHSNKGQYPEWKINEVRNE